MKTLLLTLALATTCFGQAVRFDSEVTTVNASCVSGKQCPLLALPGSSISVCQGSPATKALCQASPATTYTAAGAGTSCSTLAQLTPSTGGACRSTADSQGNWGMWMLPGSYSYYITVPSTAGGGTTGPYPLSIQGAAGGYVLDSLYATLAEACTAAGTGTLAITKAWTATPTQTGCKMWFLGNGLITMAAGATLTMPVPTAPENQRIFNTSAATSSVVFTGPGDLQVAWWGADPTTVVDATEQIQDAMTATTGARNLRCGPGVYKISATLYLPSFVTFSGPLTDFLNSYGGCTLTWYGSAPATPYVHGSAMLEAYKVNGTNVSGINFEGQATTNLTGYMDDAQGGGIAQRNSIKNSAFFRFGNPATDAPGAAMVYGTEGYSGIIEQVDGVENIDNTGTNVYLFIRINNLNFAYSRFQRSSAVYFNKGMDIRASGWARVESPAYGLTMGTNPCVFCFSGTHGQWTFNQVQSEQDASITMNPKMFLIDQSAGQPGDPSPIIITNSIFGYPSTISAPNANIISKGNYGGPASAITITAAANATLVTKEADYPDTVWTIQNGTSSVKNLGVPIARGSIQEFDMSFDDSNATPIVKYQVNPIAPTMTEPFNQYRNLVGGVDTARWTNFWSTTSFGFKDLTTSYKFLTFANGLNTGDGIQCVIGSCTVAGVSVNRIGGSPIFTRYFITQGGINGAITVTSTDGTYAPSLANPAFCVYLDNNTLIGGAGNTISFNGAAPVAIFNKQNSAQITTTYAVGTTFCGLVGGSGLIHEQ